MTKIPSGDGRGVLVALVDENPHDQHVEERMTAIDWALARRSVDIGLDRDFSWS